MQCFISNWTPGAVRAVNGPCMGNPCALPHVQQRASTVQPRKNTTRFTMQSSRLLLFPDLPPWEQYFHAYVHKTRVHAARHLSAHFSALCFILSLCFYIMLL